MTTINPERLEQALQRAIHHGGHKGWEHGACVMEAVAYVAGEAWSDSPSCACPVIAAFMRNWNDSLRSDEERDRLLKPFIAKLVGSRSTPEVESRRAYMSLDWLIRVQTPAWLDLAGLAEPAQEIRDLAEIVDLPTAEAAAPVVRAAQKTAAAAWAAAWAAAGAAAWAKLEPTVTALQQSAAELVDRMLAA